tara:strand:+ start:276 stop:488 length:213 start_codon:yes stop_codon:yes gene_type:complete
MNRYDSRVRLKRVAQLAEDDTVLVGAELRQRHRGARLPRTDREGITSGICCGFGSEKKRCFISTRTRSLA